MGIRMSTLHTFDAQGLFGYGRRILDFGSSNLYGAPASEIADFVRKYNPKPRSDLESWADSLAFRSGTAEDGQARNEAFVGELLEAAGMIYDAIDIADGYKTTIVDLNSRSLPRRMRSYYDTVMNCGTSEHILNQYNTFKAVHDAAKVGGIMLHQVPSVGYTDHCYFCYTSRFFCDLAGYNHYAIEDLWYDGSVENEKLYDSIRQYQSIFPALKKRVEAVGSVEMDTKLDAMTIPTVSIGVIFRKETRKPFSGTVEMSTSVGTIFLGRRGRGLSRWIRSDHGRLIINLPWF